jgi:hypothetical protein
MISAIQRLVKLFTFDHDLPLAIKKHHEVRQKIEHSTDKLRMRTEELLSEMIRNNECDKNRNKAKPDD